MTPHNTLTLKRLMRSTLARSLSYVRYNKQRDCEYIDPIEKRTINAHYGATHLAAALLQHSIFDEDDRDSHVAIDLLRSILASWNESKKQGNFHHDFNNFALCVAFDRLPDNENELRVRIREVVINTPDSSHMTINWLPMRMYVNQKRYDWSQKPDYLREVDRLSQIVSEATNPDGSIEDMLPKGTSYNLQYNIATLAGLQFWAIATGNHLNLSRKLAFLMERVLPDGDVNYQGRGTNQVFAWGPWIYLLATSGQDEMLTHCLGYFGSRLNRALENDNIFLNDVQGTERHLWWDYHFGSVYIAHLAFWLALALAHRDCRPEISRPEVNAKGHLDSVKSKNAHVCVYSGSSMYPAEFGPAVNAIWVRNFGMLAKASLGPWGGLFGNLYSKPEVVVRNFIGLIELKTEIKLYPRKLLERAPFLPMPGPSEKIKPSFLNVSIDMSEYELKMTYKNSRMKNLFFNMPSLIEYQRCPIITAVADGMSLDLFCNTKIKTQYGWCDLIQTKAVKAAEWQIKINFKSQSFL